MSETPKHPRRDTPTPHQTWRHRRLGDEDTQPAVSHPRGDGGSDTDDTAPWPDDVPGSESIPPGDASAREMSSTRLLGGEESASGAASSGVRRRSVSMGDFELLKKIGEGAMGAVYRARQTSFDREVALKVLFPHIAKNPKLVERLYREARAMAQLDHPNIVQAYAVGFDEDAGCHFVAMEFVDGQNLQKWLTQVNRLSVADAVYVTIRCARALAYAHKRGMVHRDVKPENILVTTSSEVKLADLGMVKTFDDDMALTQTGHAVGTPWYMPLEQARNAKDTDGRSDIYALGCTLYCLLTGSPPFAGGTIVDVIRAKEVGTFPPARAANPDVPERLELVIAKMTAKLARYRYQTCDEVIGALESLGLAGKALELVARPPVDVQATKSPSSGEIVTATRVEDATLDPEVWYIRTKGPDGQPVTRKFSTEQLRKKLAEGSIDPRVKASHNAKEGFRALAAFREFEGTALSKASKQAADANTVRYRNLYKKIDEQDRQRVEAQQRRAREWPPWATSALTITGVILAVLLLSGFLYWVVKGLLG